MELTLLGAFLAVVAVLIVLPGPDWALVVAAGMQSRRVVVPTVAGLAIGYLLLTSAVAAGVAPLVAAAPAALVVLTVVGAGYLIYLGVGNLRRSPTRRPEAPGVDARGAGRTLLRGVGVAALNPKSLLFFVAFLPQFASPDAAWPFVVQLMVLGGLWVAVAAVFYTLLGCTAERTVARHPALAGAVTRVAGVAMIVAGAYLLGERLVGHVTLG